MLDQFLSQCNLGNKEIQLYKICIKLGKATAASIADLAGRERTSTYKMLNNMAQDGFLYTQKDNHTTYFLPISIDNLKQLFDQKSQNISIISQNYDLVLNEYHQIKSPYDHQTTINIYDGLPGIKNAFEQIYDIVIHQDLLIIKCIASQTFESMANIDPKSKYISEIYSDFLSKMQTTGKLIYSYLGQGISLMESMLITKSYSDISQLPNANDSTAIYIVADNIFMMIYTHKPKVIHIASPELSNLFYFLLEKK